MRKPAFRGKGVSPIIPERVDALSRVQLSDGVRPSLRNETPVGIPHLRPKQRVIEPAFGGIHIKIGRHKVVIARSTTRSSLAIKLLA